LAQEDLRGHLALSGTVVDYSHDVGGLPVTSYRSQAARRAAHSSRATFGDLAGLPLLMRAPCSHCDQISPRGSHAALAAPICPQCGQTIRISISLTTAAGTRGKRKRQFPNDLAQRAGVPPAAAQDRLLTPGAGIARRLRAHPARLSRFVAKKSVQKLPNRHGNPVLFKQGTYPRFHIPQRRR